MQCQSKQKDLPPVPESYGRTQDKTKQIEKKNRNLLKFLKKLHSKSCFKLLFSSGITFTWFNSFFPLNNNIKCEFKCSEYQAE